MRHRRGFSLIESVVAAGIVGILMLAMAGVLGLAARAMPGENDSASRSARASAVLGDLADDLASASAVVAATASTLSLRVPDRDGDATADVVTYQYIGGSLTRKLNSRTAGIALPGLESFAFSPEWTEVGRRSSTAAALGTSQRLAMHSPTIAGTLRVGVTTHLAQVVIPRLDEDVVSWTPTSIRVRMSLKSGLLSSITCRLFEGDVTRGSTVTLLATGVNATLLSGASAGWVSFDFNGAPEITRGRPVTIIVSALNLLSTTDVVCQTAGAYDGFLTLAHSTNSGGSWTTYNEGAMGFEILGQMRRPGTSITTTSRLDALVVDMQLGGVGRVRRTFAVPGRPAME